MVVDGEVIENLLALEMHSSTPVPECELRSSSDASNKVQKNRGRPSLVSQFPQIPQLVTDLIKQHGFSAHSRRRTEVGGTCGVSLGDIQKHIISQIPQLKGIGRTTIAYMMAPPHKGTISGSRYKSIVSARVPKKSNQYRENHIDQHYLFARVAYRREFTSKFHQECVIYSCDDMNKVKVGPMAVSRYLGIFTRMTNPTTLITISPCRDIC